MLTNIPQATLVSLFQATLTGSPTPASITALVTADLALNTGQSSSFLTYITANQAGWSGTITDIGMLSSSHYATFLSTIANLTPLDIGSYVNQLTELTAAQGTSLAAFMLSINPVGILVESSLLVPVAQSDYIRRLISLFPNYWAGDVAKNPGGILYALLNAAALILNEVNVVFQSAQESFYLTTATGTALNAVVSDFFLNFPRTGGETDAHYAARAYASLFAGGPTRAAIQAVLNAIASTRLIEPWRPSDTGVWDGVTGAYYDSDAATFPGRYTDASLRYQGFADVSLANSTIVPLFQYTINGGGQALPGAVTVHGGGQSGSTLATTGWKPSKTNLVTVGMTFYLATGQTVEAVQNASSDGSGNITISLNTVLLTAPANGSAVMIIQPQNIGFFDQSYFIDSTAGVGALQQAVYNVILTNEAEGTQIWVRFV